MNDKNQYFPQTKTHNNISHKCITKVIRLKYTFIYIYICALCKNSFNKNRLVEFLGNLVIYPILQACNEVETSSTKSTKTILMFASTIDCLTVFQF